jgi:hypothetical protein
MKSIEKATPRNLSFIKKLAQWYVKNPVLVYSMGKVGSSSIVNTLRDIGIDEVQPHSFTISRRGSYFVLPNRGRVKKLKDKIKSNLLKLKGKLYFFTKRITGEKIKVITLTRDPLARTISAYFEQYQYVLGKDINQVNTKDLIANFFEFANHHTPHIWFDNEIKAMLGADVYKLDFDREIGWHKVQTRYYHLLIIKMESLSSLEEPLAKLFNVNEFVLKPTNRSDFKVYKTAYDRFRQEIRFSKEYLDFHYNSRYATHFYTKKELSDFRKKWIEITD